MPAKKKSTKKPLKHKKVQAKAKAPLAQAPVAPAEVIPKVPELLQTVKGMRDILPNEEALWTAVQNTASSVSGAFGYSRIETPMLEHKALFVRGVGSTTDVVQKEMYCFKDQGGDEVCLRPEGTAAVARAYINHGMLNLPQPVKLWYLGPFFRRERPQAGRYRQFHQWSVEVFGDEHPVLDSEVISVAVAFFRDLSIPVNVEINSIGCTQCRGGYKEELFKFYNPKQELLCEACKTRLQTNRLRLLDCKEPQCELLKEGAPQITDFLCEACRDHFMRVLEYLDEVGVSYTLNPYIVRGLDYYNRTVFEIFGNSDAPPAAKEENVSPPPTDGSAENPAVPETQPEEKPVVGRIALGGGGRYDGLVSELGGRPTPAVGFSMGLERIVSVLKANGKITSQRAPRIFIAQLGDAARRKVLSLWHALYKDVPVVAALSKDGLKAQLEIANRLQVRYAIIIGQKEILDQTAIIRDMEAGIQEVVDYNKVVSEIKKKVSDLL